LGLAKRVNAKILWEYWGVWRLAFTTNRKLLGKCKPWDSFLYDERENVAETLFMDCTQSKIKVSYKIINFQYGPLTWIRRTVGWFSNFIVQASRGENITIFWDAAHTLFQYVDDLVEGMIRMMNSDDSFFWDLWKSPESPLWIYDAGTGSEKR
jgi:UDP-glucuronate decarboxylase